MTRSDLVEELAARFGQLTQRDAELAVKTILDAMSEALSRGHRIEIRGFGSFSVGRRAPRIGRNPRSGEQVAIPERRVAHFKPGKALREAVDAGTPAGNRRRRLPVEAACGPGAAPACRQAYMAKWSWTCHRPADRIAPFINCGDPDVGTCSSGSSRPVLVIGERSAR